MLLHVARRVLPSPWPAASPPSARSKPASPSPLLWRLRLPRRRQVRDRVRRFAESEIAPVICEYWEKAAFPFELVPGFQVQRGMSDLSD